MPIYEYKCPDCGHDFEVLQKFSDDPVRDCPQCKAGNVRKCVSATSFVLKGGGWYKDHYGLKSGGDAKPAASEGSGSTPAVAAAGAAAPASAPAPAAAPASGGSSSGGSGGGSGGSSTAAS